MTNRFIPAMLAVALMTATTGGAFAADMSKKEKAEIVKTCKETHKGDKAAIKACIKAGKKDAAAAK